jgi:hypothetical protein
MKGSAVRVRASASHSEAPLGSRPERRRRLTLGTAQSAVAEFAVRRTKYGPALRRGQARKGANPSVSMLDHTPCVPEVLCGFGGNP